MNQYTNNKSKKRMKNFFSKIYTVCDVPVSNGTLNDVRFLFFLFVRGCFYIRSNIYIYMARF